MEASYTPAFKACVEAGARSVMCSYNAVNGKPSCANPELLQDLLRYRQAGRYLPGARFC